MNSSKPLVSLITPCYNGADHIHRLLDSVLNQDYSNIEHYVIDDGSIDCSADVIKSYIPKYAERNYSLIYLHQSNSGQSVAINKGLKLISGDYLLWPDADDYYSQINSISSLVNVLINSATEIGMVRCFLKFCNEDTGETRIVHSTKNINIKKQNLFRDAVFSLNNFWYIPGGFAVKTECLKNEIPDLEIFSCKEAGQNFQLLFPLLYKYECITIPDYLYTIVEREQSHSRQFKSIQDIIKQQEIYELTSVATIKRLKGMSENIRNQLLLEVGAFYDFKMTLIKMGDKNNTINLYHFIRQNYPRLSFMQWLIVLRAFIFKFIK